MKKCFLAALLLLVVFAALLYLRLSERFDSHHLKITFFDVGQGDSILVQFPLGKNLLVDGGGGSPKRTKGRLIIPELRSKGILNLDAVLLTHPDSDHILGFKDIASTIPIGEYWINPVFTDEKIVPLLWQVEWLFKNNQVNARYIGKTEQIQWQGVEMKLFPSKGVGENDQCLVLQLNYGGCRVLLTGDIEKEGEKIIADSLKEKVHLLKIAHHGSGTSSTKMFLRKTSPNWSVLSVGWANRYGHPKNFVSERLRAIGSEIFRTDWHGSVEFTISSTGRVECQTARGPCGVSKCL